MTTRKVISIVAVITLLVIIFFVIRAMKKNQSNIISDPTGFLSALYTWVLAEAGGLQDKVVAGDIHAERSPCVVTIGERTYVHPHTNKDIQYGTFKKYAPKFGYSIDCATFLAMPFDLWRQIFYAISIKKGLAYTKNLVLAAYVGSWYWGSGSISVTNINKIKSILSAGVSDRDKLDALILLRKAHFATLHNNNPTEYSLATLNAWNDRADSFREHFQSYLAA